MHAVTKLPEDLTKLPSEMLEERAEVRDRHVYRLFRRWPALTAAELAELQRLYNERLRLAKSLGARQKAA